MGGTLHGGPRLTGHENMLASPQDQSEAQILLRALQDVNVGSPQWRVGSSLKVPFVPLKSSVFNILKN